MHDYKRNFGNLVRAARLKQDYTQEKLAEMLDIQQRTILEIENGRGNTQFDILFPLVRLLNIPGDDIFYFDRTTPTTEVELFLHELSAFPEEVQRYALAAAFGVLRQAREFQEEGGGDNSSAPEPAAPPQ